MSMDAERLAELDRLQGRLGYRYKDKGLLNVALTHSSHANEMNLSMEQYNERLEFLGDAVLEMITSELLYNRFEEYPEGVLTKIRAGLVNGQALGRYARKLGLGRFLLVGKGEKISGGNERVSVLADALEAVIGSIYIDGGYREASKFVCRYIESSLQRLEASAFAPDCKTALQEKVQAKSGLRIEYRLKAQSGPDHDKTFRVQVYIGDVCYAEGIGKSKKEAEQEAAKKALRKLEG